MARNFQEKATLFFATGLYLSLIPPRVETYLRTKPWFSTRMRSSWTGSGIAGSIWGLVTYLLLPYYLAVNLVVLVGAGLLAVWNSQRAEQILLSHDDSRIVIDEWIGCWIAMAGLRHHFGFEVITAFILFRLFDVYKGPWGQRLQRLPGGWGVVLDDVAAGILANVCARFVIVFVGVL